MYSIQWTEQNAPAKKLRTQMKACGGRSMFVRTSSNVASLSMRTPIPHSTPTEVAKPTKKNNAARALLSIQLITRSNCIRDKGACKGARRLLRWAFVKVLRLLAFTSAWHLVWGTLSAGRPYTEGVKRSTGRLARVSHSYWWQVVSRWS